MKIRTNYINTYFQLSKTTSRQEKSDYITIPISPTSITNNYKYDINVLNFKARLNRTPENFYAQDFNIKNMPDTVRNYLMEDFDTRHHMPPAQLQREAFQYIKLADTVNDVKKIYPDEPLFKNLKSFDETKASHGILLLLRWDKKTSNTQVFKNKDEKDLALYLLKKVYIEGKTIEEINKDFEKDATDAIKKELGVKDGKYFFSSTLNAMGVRYPNLAYYNSFVATRNDKEYIPPVRNTQQSTKIVTEETKEKLSASSKKWWAGLNELERDEQIQKMLEGKKFSSSIFSKFQGQIMTIAAAKIGFSEKLSQIFAVRLNDNEFNQNFPTFEEKMREIMLEFWNKDPDFKKSYAKATKETISAFEEAYNDKDEHPEKLEKLLNQALDMKKNIIDKAKQKKLQKREELNKETGKKTEEANNNAAAPTIQKEKNTFSPYKYSKKEINILFREQEAESVKYYPDIFGKALLDFLCKNIDTNTKRLAIILHRKDAQSILQADDEKFKQIKEDFYQKVERINHKFDSQNLLLAKTHECILNEFMYLITKNPKEFMKERGDIYDRIINFPQLQEVFLMNKQILTKELKKNNTLLGKEEALKLLQNRVLKRLEDYRININNIENGLIYDKKFKNESIKFIQNYNAYAKELQDESLDEEAKKAIETRIAAEYYQYICSVYNNTIDPME